MNLPCLSHNAPCPFLDNSGKPSSWVCCGARGVSRKLNAMQDCPQIDIVRAEWRKTMKKSYATTRIRGIMMDAETQKERANEWLDR